MDDIFSSKNYEGSLFIEQSGGEKKAWYIPPRDLINEFISTSPDDYKWKLLDFDTKNDRLTVYPFYFDNGEFEPKYNRLLAITLVGFNILTPEETISAEGVIDILEGLPAGCVKRYDVGLGLTKECYSIVEMLEGLNVTHLTISKNDPTAINESKESCTIKFAEFDEMRRAANRVTVSARTVGNQVRSTSVYNYFAYFLNNEKYPQRGLSISDNLISRLVNTTVAKVNARLSAEERKTTALQTVRNSAARIVKEQPEAIAKLRNDLELLSLEQLIQKFESLLQKKLPESHWQKLFNENPFILSMAFGFPIIKINEQATVGGKKISGSGEKITDFLLKNSITNNAAVFEIKTPQTKLLGKLAYRNGVYTPSSDLTGAVNQILDQIHYFERDIATLKNNSGIYDLETYAVHGVLIIGQSLTDADEQKSFELYRGNSKNITIITFDEVLKKLKQLRQFLSAN